MAPRYVGALIGAAAVALSLATILTRNWAFYTFFAGALAAAAILNICVIPSYTVTVEPGRFKLVKHAKVSGKGTSVERHLLDRSDVRSCTIVSTRNIGVGHLTSTRRTLKGS
jgi:hypothetical protein